MYCVASWPLCPCAVLERSFPAMCGFNVTPTVHLWFGWGKCSRQRHRHLTRQTTALGFVFASWQASALHSKWEDETTWLYIICSVQHLQRQSVFLGQIVSQVFSRSVEHPLEKAVAIWHLTLQQHKQSWVSLTDTTDTERYYKSQLVTVNHQTVIFTPIITKSIVPGISF